MTLGEKLGYIEHLSLLQRKASRLGMFSVKEGIGVAVNRGCKHYDMGLPTLLVREQDFSDEELVIFLLLLTHDYEPMAIRAAGQLLGKEQLDMKQVLSLARKERVLPILSYLINCARNHDPDHDWGEERLDYHDGIKPGILPHWSRFMSIPGVGRGGKTLPPKWLVPVK